MVGNTQKEHRELDTMSHFDDKRDFQNKSKDVKLGTQVKAT
jgi:hypothetical protein